MSHIKVKFFLWFMLVQAVVLASFNYALYITVESNLKENIFGVMQTHEAIEHFLNSLWILDPFILILSSAGGYMLIRQFFRPLSTILEEIHTMSASNLSKRLKERPCEDEINELIVAFNAMLNRLQDSFEAIQTFNTNVSHELRTPLTIMRGSIEVAIRKERACHEYHTLLGQQLEEIIALQERIETLLAFEKEEMHKEPQTTLLFEKPFLHLKTLTTKPLS